MHVGRGGVPRALSVDHDDFATGPRQDQGRGQARSASTDDCYVVLAHVYQAGTGASVRQGMLPRWGIPAPAVRDGQAYGVRYLRADTSTFRLRRQPPRPVDAPAPRRAMRTPPR